MYELKCKEEFTSIKELHKEKFDNIEKKIDVVVEFVQGNGYEGAKTTLSRHERWIKLTNWFYMSVFTGVVLTVVAVLLIEHLKK